MFLFNKQKAWRCGRQPPAAAELTATNPHNCAIINLLRLHPPRRRACRATRTEAEATDTQIDNLILSCLTGAGGDQGRKGNRIVVCY